jgi:hypothetical protein
MVMPAPRAFQTAATATNDGVLLFGGEGTDGAPTGTLWRFDTTIAPNGAYQILEEHVELARSGARQRWPVSANSIADSMV